MDGKYLRPPPKKNRLIRSIISTVRITCVLFWFSLLNVVVFEFVSTASIMDKPGSLPKVQTLSESGIETVPLQYVRADLEASNPHDTQVPVIDWHGLGAPHLHLETIAAISSAAQKWGFFQIVNHEIAQSLISRVQAVAKAFFDLPLEEKEVRKNDQAGSPIGYGSKLGYSPDAKLDWGDYFYNVSWPPDRRDMSKWPKQPSDFMYIVCEEAIKRTYRQSNNTGCMWFGRSLRPREKRERGIIIHCVSGDYNESTYKKLQQPLIRQTQIKINPTIHALSINSSRYR